MSVVWYWVDSGISWRLLVAIGISVALHVVALQVLKPGLPHDGERSVFLSARILQEVRVEVAATSPIPLRSEIDAVVSAKAVPPVSAAVDLEYSQRLAPTPSGSIGVASGIIDDSGKYFPAQELDLRATPIRMQSVTRTDSSMALGHLVKLKLALFINEYGAVDRYEVLESEGVADSTVLADILETRFYPAQKNGQAVKSRKIIELSYVP